MSRPADWRASVRTGLHALAGGARSDVLASDVVWHVSAPVELLSGATAVEDGFFAPLRRALPHLRRRDLMVLGGVNRRPEGGDWIAAACHYTGLFSEPLWGVAPHGRLVFLRAGEFYRIDDGRITRAHLILDLPDLLHQTGRLPAPGPLGAPVTFPAPQPQDGVLPTGRNGERSLDLIERMIDTLHAYDPNDFSSADQTGDAGIWHDDLMWYGPGMIGSTSRWSGFVAHHRRPFLTAFPDRRGGDHFCRIGDGDYAAISGWPSMRMTHRGTYLGVPPTNRRLHLRVMDFYRCVGTTDGPGKIAENWVFLDLVDLFRQMGRDLIAEGAAPKNS